MPRHPSRGPGLPHGVTKGPGLGGPARGASTSATPESLPLYEPGNKAAENRTGGSAYRRMAKEERIAWLEDQAEAIIHTTQMDGVKSGMVQYLMDREMGKPIAKSEITGKDGAPVEMSTIRRVIVDPKSDDV